MAGGGKLHELSVRILGLEAGDARGDVVNVLVRFKVMDIGKSTARWRSSLAIAAIFTLSGKPQAVASRW